MPSPPTHALPRARQSQCLPGCALSYGSVGRGRPVPTALPVLTFQWSSVFIHSQLGSVSTWLLFLSRPLSVQSTSTSVQPSLSPRSASTLLSGSCAPVQSWVLWGRRAVGPQPTPRCPGSSCACVGATSPVSMCRAPAEREAGPDRSPGSPASVGRCAAVTGVSEPAGNTTEPREAPSARQGLQRAVCAVSS